MYFLNNGFLLLILFISPGKVLIILDYKGHILILVERSVIYIMDSGLHMPLK